MNIIDTLATGPWGIGWQEVIMIFLIIGILAGPGIVALAIIFFILRRQRRKRAVPPSLQVQYHRQP